MKPTRKLFVLCTATIAVLVLITILVSPNPSSQDTVTKIKAQLFSDPDLRKLNVEVTGRDGEIMLSGAVPDYAARLRVYEIAVNTAGEQKINDQM